MDNEDEHRSAFSIQNIVREGINIQRKPGDWYGPNAISIVLKRLNKRYKPLPNFEIVVFTEGTIYLDKVAKKSNFWGSSVLIILPLRLGLSYILPEYLQCIKQFFTISQNVGIAGGRENSALYFVGFSENNLIYLDPHYV